MAFSLDGRTLATAIDYIAVPLWDLSGLIALQKHAMERTCAMTGGGLTRTEWARYVPGFPYVDVCKTSQGRGDRRGRPHTHCQGLRQATCGAGLPISLAVAVGSALGDDMCVTHDNTGEPLSPPPAELLDLLRRIADHDDAPDTVQADARDYLRYREAASSGSAPLTGEVRLAMAATAALWNGREVVARVPRPRCGTT